MIHDKCLALGDGYCLFKTVSTTQEDRENFFAENKDWSHVDPLLARFYSLKEDDES
jgi:hypothetical protein